MSPMRLADLLEGVSVVPLTLAGQTVSAMTLDSRRVQPGGAFVALAGASTHGLHHLDAALAAGAGCILFEPPAPTDRVLPPTALPVPGLRGQLGRLADRFHGQPSVRLTVIGVTGTNGKTSTVQLLAQALDQALPADDAAGGHDNGGAFAPAGSIGTLGVGFRGEIRVGERTTPDVISVHAALADLVERGARSVAMEVSSHALDQGRVDAVAFDVAVFSNLTRDHLDYHGDMASYGAAKAKLFSWPSLRAAVVNVDDPFGQQIAGSLRADIRSWTVSARGSADASLRAEAVRCDAGGLRFDVCEGGHRLALSSRLLGRFNVDNLLAVMGCLRALGWSLDAAVAAAAGLRPVAGRMNRIDARSKSAPLVVVDYAHTPDALQQTLDSLRAHTKGQLLCVFGCGGERDRGKRPEMAAAVESKADRIVLTDDNPRGEDGDRIIADTLAGFRDPAAVTVNRDRATAIGDALRAAGSNDCVLIAGKGHETYQEVGGRRLPFDDAACARRWLEAHS